LGDTFLDAKDLAMVAALLVNKSFGGCVESVVTVFTHRFVFLAGMATSSSQISLE
jgi:hypothetical protein